MTQQTKDITGKLVCAIRSTPNNPFECLSLLHLKGFLFFIMCGIEYVNFND